MMRRPRADATLTAPTTELEIHYRDWGGPTERVSGGIELPPVLLLHGLASTCRIYDLCAPLLAQGRRVVAYDQRGHGGSGKPEDGYDLDTLVEDGVGVARALGLRVPYTVVGHSWGASVALRWAVRRPDDVHAAVLVDGGVSSVRDMPDATWRTVEEHLAPPTWQDIRFDNLLAHTRHGDLAFLHESFRRDFFTALTEPRPDGTIQARLSAANHWRILHGLWDDDLDTSYRALRRPALGLLALPKEPWDDRQREMVETKRRAAARRTALQPLLHVQWMDDTIHDIPLQRPAILAEAIAEV